MSRAKLNDLIDNEKFEHYYQALYDLDTLEPIGYEALLRTNLYKNPEILFEQASTTDRFYELECKSIKNALASFSELITKQYNRIKILINVFPANLKHPDFLAHLLEFMENKKFEPKQVIIEINESDILNKADDLTVYVQELKDAGFLIAIDDVGKGVSSLQAIVELQPDYVKMDRYFANQLATSSRKQEMVRSIVTYCLHTDTKFVLEGVEIPEDLEMAKSIGVSIVQGFLLAVPLPIDKIKLYQKTLEEAEEQYE